MSQIDKNTILYGPPGTGKTYHTVLYAVAIVEGKALEQVIEEDYSAVLARYRRYQEQKRIGFTTFHQSYGYEEFVEGIRPVLERDENGEAGELTYDVRPGIFKAFCEQTSLPLTEDGEVDLGINRNPTIWKVSLERTGDNETRRECLENGHIRIRYDSYGEHITDETDYSRDGGRYVLNAFINRMKVGDLVLSCYSESNIDAVGVITGEYEWHDEYPQFKRLRKVKWLVKGINLNVLEHNGGKTMKQFAVHKMGEMSLTYVMDIIRVYSQEALESVQQNYVFIIDEINRGNISKILGELITLIEPERRLGQPQELKVQLAYSGDEFGIPDNVYILGTMNTADRSIALLDTALRRRFRFVEMPPCPDLLSDVTVGEVNIGDMLEKLNRRIAALYDREHAIGHAYFMPLKDMSLNDQSKLELLGDIFAHSIIPLLQEYFYEDYGRIRLVLGDEGKAEDNQFIQVIDVDDPALMDNGLDGGVVYQINRKAFGHIEAYKL